MITEGEWTTPMKRERCLAPASYAYRRCFISCLSRRRRAPDSHSSCLIHFNFPFTHLRNRVWPPNICVLCVVVKCVARCTMNPVGVSEPVCVSMFPNLDPRLSPPPCVLLCKGACLVHGYTQGESRHFFLSECFQARRGLFLLPYLDDAAAL